MAVKGETKMTKEQVEKHGEVIKWFCEIDSDGKAINAEKGVWGKLHSPEEWTLIFKPNFSVSETFIQNDKYAELRKAQADGKIIEFNYLSSGYGKCKEERWEQLLGTISEYSHYKLRIKPDEPTFKVGDFVRHNPNCNCVHEERIYKVKGKLKDGWLLPVKGHGTNYIDISKGIELWQPQEGDEMTHEIISLADEQPYLVHKLIEALHEKGHAFTNEDDLFNVEIDDWYRDLYYDGDWNLCSASYKPEVPRISLKAFMQMYFN